MNTSILLPHEGHYASTVSTVYGESIWYESYRRVTMPVHCVTYTVCKYSTLSTIYSKYREAYNIIPTSESLCQYSVQCTSTGKNTSISWSHSRVTIPLHCHCHYASTYMVAIGRSRYTVKVKIHTPRYLSKQRKCLLFGKLYFNGNEWQTKVHIIIKWLLPKLKVTCFEFIIHGQKAISLSCSIDQVFYPDHPVLWTGVDYLSPECSKSPRSPRSRSEGSIFPSRVPDRSSRIQKSRDQGFNNPRQL